MEKVEKNIFREHGVFLPLGLPKNFGTRLRNGYTGTKPQIFFVCPKICAVDYYYKAYKRFKSNFRGFPYVIAGKPFGKIADRHLLGYLPREEFDRVFCESRLMYYHSTEPRHLHYHPLEAIYANQPLIFMSKGMLGQLTPKVKYPGAADTILEAKIKVLRLLANDRSFIRDIQESQQELLSFFTPEYVKKYWVKNFLPLVEDAEKKDPSPVVPVEREHIGIILPLGYRGGTLHAFIQIVKMLRACGYQVTIGLPNDYFEKGELYYPAILEDVQRKLGKENSDIPIRFFTWTQPSPTENLAVRRMARLPSDLQPYQPFCVMDDNVNHFCECDRWLFVSDRFYKGVPLPLRPYSVIVYDYLQRYMPFQLLPESLENIYMLATRYSEGMFVTNEETSRDLSVYQGISPEKVFRLPFEFTADEMQKYCSLGRPPVKNKRPYIVWACNRAWHKNHVRVLTALIRYYCEFDGTLEVFVTGIDTKLLDYRQGKKGKDPDRDVGKNENNVIPPHILEFRKLFKKNKAILRDNVHIKGELDRYTYFDLISGAKFLLLSSFCDNGAFGAVEAAWLGIPCASSDYPHMRYMAQYFGINPLWYHGENSDNILDALLRMQKGSEEEYRGTLPSRELLKSKSYELQRETIQKTLREAWS